MRRVLLLLAATALTTYLAQAGRVHHDNAVAATRADFAIAGDKTATTIPFELVDNRIFIKVRLNGRGPFDFIFDTGSSAVIRPEVAQELSLKAEMSGEGFGVGEKPVVTGNTLIDRVEVGDVQLAAEPFSIMSFAETPVVFGNHPVDGVIGAPLLERLVVSVDYENRVLRFTRPESFNYQGTGTVVPFERPRNMPVVDGMIDGVRGKFGIDTGARSALLLYGPFVDSNHLRTKYSPKVQGITGWGFGGPVRSQVVRAQSLQLGPVVAKNLVVRLSLQRSGATTSADLAGLVGPDVLDQFRVTFDYSRSRIILEPNHNYGTPDTYDRSGMWLGQVGKFFEVLDLTAGGPAEKAGLKVGDRIVSIDGHSTATLLLPDVRQGLRNPPNRKVKVVVARKEGQRELSLTLRDLV